MYPQNKKLHDDNIALFKQSEMLCGSPQSFFISLEHFGSSLLHFSLHFLSRRKMGACTWVLGSCIHNGYGMLETLHTTVMIPCVHPIGEMGYWAHKERFLFWWVLTATAIYCTFPKFLSVDSSDICKQAKHLSHWHLFWRTYQTVHHTPQQIF